MSEGMTAEQKERDIKETMEILNAVELFTVAGGKVSADGKVDMSDLVHLVDVAKNYNTVEAAVKDADQAVLEFKDLDQGEIITLIAKAFAIVKAFKESRQLPTV